MVNIRVLSILSGVVYTPGGPYDVYTDNTGTVSFTWDESVLGPRPTQEQLEAAWVQYNVVKAKNAARAELATLDLQAIRPLRAIAAGTDTQFDRDKLAQLDARAAELRAIINGDT